MKTTLILEELSLFVLALIVFTLQSPYAWWLIPVCILLPDISMLGYLAGNRTGAFVYNFIHHKGIALLVYLLGWYFRQDWVLFTGIILFAHSAMDRMFGYGLKYVTGFKYTHLGKIGKEA